MSSNSDAETEPAEVIDPLADDPWPPSEWSMPLRRPLKTLADETLDHLHLREPTGEEWEQILAWPEATRRRKGVSLIAGLPMGDVAKIPIGDLVRAEAYLTSFFEIGRVIGVS